MYHFQLVFHLLMLHRATLKSLFAFLFSVLLWYFVLISISLLALSVFRVMPCIMEIRCVHKTTVIMVIVFCVLGHILVVDRFRPAPLGPLWTAGEDDSYHNCLRKGRWKEVCLFFCVAPFFRHVGSCSCLFERWDCKMTDCGKCCGLL